MIGRVIGIIEKKKRRKKVNGEVTGLVGEDLFIIIFFLEELVGEVGGDW